jgi:asparagine synthase (glutamine-hydrolysing)
MGSARMDAELAANLGALAMFTGGGGDQQFFEFHRPWPAADCLRAHGLGPRFFAAAMDAARLGRTSVWAAIRLAFADRWSPATPALTVPQPPHLFTEAACAEAGRLADASHELMHPAMQTADPLPIGKRQQAQQLVHPFDPFDPFEREAAPELVNPLMSQPLTELCLRLPTYVLTHGGCARGLARLAFRADLPADIATRRAKGGMAGHIQSVLLNGLPFVQDVLLDGELVRRGLVDRRRAEALLRGSRTAVAHRAGEIHACLAVEAWLQRHRRAQQRQAGA